MAYVELSRASKNYECSKCRSQIKRGSLYVLWRRPYVRGPNTEKYCLKCADMEIVYMLQKNVSALFIYMNEEGVTSVVPRKDKVLSPEHRRTLISCIS